jgi:hypothetical protein
MLSLPDRSAMIPTGLEVFFPMGPGEYVEDGPILRLDKRDIETLTDQDLENLIAARIAPYQAAHPEWRIEAHRAWTFGGLSGGSTIVQEEAPTPSGE